jgi:hypothetical protein
MRVEAQTGCRVTVNPGPDQTGGKRLCKVEYTGILASRSKAKAEMHQRFTIPVPGFPGTWDLLLKIIIYLLI